jgi:microcystin-dependent protein
MSDEPYVGEIRMFGGNFAPAGWENCDGRALLLSDPANADLFDMIGTTYGGDGLATFNTPDLRGRVPIHMGAAPGGSSYTIADSGGVESVTLTVQQIPVHTHALTASTGGGATTNPQGNVTAANNDPKLYLAASPDVQLAPSAVAPAGGSQPHENRMPFVVIRYIISKVGVKAPRPSP